MSDQHEHLPWNRQRLASLQHYADAGCHLCSIVFRALRAFHGDWISAQAEKLEFSQVGIYGRSPLIALHLKDCKDVPEGYEQYTGSIYPGAQTELVFEPKETNIAKFERGAQPLGGCYADLQLKTGRQLPAHPAENISLMQEWIEDCFARHSACQITADPRLPKRVIKLGTSQKPIIRLEETDGQCGRYAALSHRWGVDVLLTTTRDTLASHKQQIDWTSLSRTLQDAITITRRLELEFLWIDCLCIVQDDKADWQVESSKMASIYENAHITIAANTSSDGFLESNAIRPPKSVRLQSDMLGEEPVNLALRTPCQHNNFYASALEGGMLGEEDYPLSQRAWCFQERLLATRVLQFTDTEVVFECKTGQQCECGTINHGYGTPIKHLFSAILQEDFKPIGWVDSIWDGWTTILRPYVTKDITYPSDVLPALAGLASRMQPKFGRYISGLWENELATGLFWFADIMEPLENPVVTGPTFSWTSPAARYHVKELTWPYRSDDSDSEQLLTILNVDCFVDGLNAYGTVSSAAVKLAGPAMTVQLTANNTLPGQNAILRSGRREQSVRFWMDSPSLATLDLGMDFVCLLGFIWTQKFQKKEEHLASALLLKQSEQTGVYERVGCIPHLKNDDSWLQCTSRIEMTVI